ncbi:MAG: SiaB family protein kinase [Campylobacterales bacterium]|nr:SiaB family protein kinase [Campylobacterales bacterium]
MNISKIRNMVEDDHIIFLTYGGFLSQNLISGMTEALESETEHNEIKLSTATNIFTIFIELSQNMMNYSKSIDVTSTNKRRGGLILVGKDQNSNYFIHSQNIVCDKDKEKLELLKTMTYDEVKKKYRELRRLGSGKHAQGAGIGFYEIAKRCDKLEYEFEYINENRYYFNLKTFILKKD